MYALSISKKAKRKHHLDGIDWAVWLDKCQSNPRPFFSCVTNITNLLKVK